MSDRSGTGRFIAHIVFGLASIRRLSEHFEDVAAQADCRPAAAKRGDIARAVSLHAAAHACIAALAERTETAAAELDELLGEARDM